MTISHPADNDPCVHKQDRFDDWDDIYEVELPFIHLTRVCPECYEEEEYTLEPDKESDFMRYFTKLKMNRSNGDIEDIGLQLVTTDGINAEAHLSIVRNGEEEIVSDKPYYFFY